MIYDKIKICFIGANPYFEGGMGLYQKNLINYIKKNNKNLEMYLIYFGRKDKYKKFNDIHYIQIGNKLPYPLDQILDNFKVLRYLKKNNFDIINSHALWGYWMRYYKKKKGQKLIHTYHGVTYEYFKVHLKRFNILKKILLSPMLLFSYVLEKPPVKKADEIICVSEKVKNQLKNIYMSKREMKVLRTGVNLNEFKLRNKEEARKRINLDKEKLYGLYIGKGGYWIKGLDRAVKISQKIYKKNKDYRLVIVGAEKNKIKHLIEEEFIIYKENVPREKISLYYNAADFLFYLSRYDGGAPTLVVSEAMASGCPVIFSKDSQQEIIEDNKNGLIIDKFCEEEAKKIMNLIQDDKKQKEILKNSMETIRNISLERWGRKYFEILKNNSN